MSLEKLIFTSCLAYILCAKHVWRIFTFLYFTECNFSNFTSAVRGKL